MNRATSEPLVERATAYVDLANKSVQVIGGDGEHLGTWSGVTTRDVGMAIRPEGWLFPAGSDWVTTSDGRHHNVVRLDHRPTR